MKRYKDLDDDSGIRAYETGSDFIRAQFEDRSVYLYTYSDAGRANIERMKKLAAHGDGLNEFINKNVRKRCERKER